MATTLPQIISGSARVNCSQAAASVRTLRGAWRAGTKGCWWSHHREASLNWLALGMLLAAWNASDNAAATQTRRRPEALRGYSPVSVRAATIHSAEFRTPPRSRWAPGNS